MLLIGGMCAESRNAESGVLWEFSVPRIECGLGKLEDELRDGNL